MFIIYFFYTFFVLLLKFGNCKKKTENQRFVNHEKPLLYYVAQSCQIYGWINMTFNQSELNT